MMPASTVDWPALSDIQLVLTVDGPPEPRFETPERPGPYFDPARGKSWAAIRAEMQEYNDIMAGRHADHVAAARAELERRQVDVEAVRKRMRAIASELRRLDDDEVTYLSIMGEGDIGIIAAEVYYGRM